MTKFPYFDIADHTLPSSLLSFLTILTINVFPFGEFSALVKDENVNNGSLSKQNNSLEKKNFIPQNKESYHALLITERTGKLEDTPDPKAEMPTSQKVHSLRASRGKVWRNQNGSQTWDLLPFQECRWGTAQYSNRKTQRDTIRDSSVLIP